MKYFLILLLLIVILIASGCTNAETNSSGNPTTVTTIMHTPSPEPTPEVIPWKNPDIPGFAKYENKTYNFRLQYPEDITPSTTTQPGGYIIFLFGNVYLKVFESTSPNDVETELFNLADEVRYNSLGHFPIMGQMPTVKTKTNVSDSPAILVTWPGTDNNYTHLGIQTNKFGYIFVYNQIEPEKSIVESFELINSLNTDEHTVLSETAVNKNSPSYHLSSNDYKELLHCQQGVGSLEYCLDFANRTGIMSQEAMKASWCRTNTC